MADRFNHFVSHLECGLTGKRHEAGRVHGLSGDGRPLLVRYDLDRLAAAVTPETMAGRTGGFWKWREFLPVTDGANIARLGEVTTPLIPLSRMALRLGIEDAGGLVVKDEGRLPTGSFKARGLGLAVAMAKELGLSRLAMPTQGNAGAAMAAYASRAGLESYVFCPVDAPEISIREIAIHGAAVFRVDGLINDCGRIVAAGKERMGWFDLSTLKEPYRIEGKKTMGLELARQMNWSLPDVIFYPTGGGTGLIGMWKAFAELEAIGWLKGGKKPRMVAVQSTGCAPIVRAYEAGERHATLWENADTFAAGIRVPVAVGDFLILDAVRESGGFAIAVPDAAIEQARAEAAATDGLLMCPEGAATLAAYKQALADGRVDVGETAVLFNCGTGLKYPMPDRSIRLGKAEDVDWSLIETAGARPSATSQSKEDQTA